MVKNILNKLKKRLTMGFVISSFVSLLLAIAMRYLFEYYLGIVPERGGSGTADLSFFALVISVRYFVVILLEEFLGEKYKVPMYNGISTTDGMEHGLSGNTLKMDKKDPLSSGKGSPSVKGSSSTSTRGSPLKNELHPSSYETPTKMLTIDETIELKKEFRKNLDFQADMVKQLRNLKQSKDLRYYLDAYGNLEMSAPSNISEKEYQDITKRVGIIDRLINVKFDEYNKLQGKDLMSNNSGLSVPYSKYRDFIKEEYKKLFDKE